MPPAYRFGKPQRFAGSDLFFYPFPRAYALGYVRSPADAGSEFRSPTARKLIFKFRFIAQEIGARGNQRRAGLHLPNSLIGESGVQGVQNLQRGIPGGTE